MFQRKKILWPLLTLLAGALLFTSSSFIKKEPLKYYKKQLEQLVEKYSKYPDETTKKEIKALKVKVIKEVAKHGQEVVVMARLGQIVSIIDKTDGKTVLATLFNGDRLKVFEYHDNNAFLVATANGNKGYLTHQQLMPSIDSFPLNILMEHPQKTSPAPTASKSEQAAKKATPLPQKTYTPTKGCTVVRCTGRTQKGTRCRRNTSNCSRRCWQH
jgi:hypothetical protein